MAELMAGDTEKEKRAWSSNFRGFHLQSQGKSSTTKRQHESMIPGDVCYLQHSGLGRMPFQGEGFLGYGLIGSFEDGHIHD